MYGRSDLLPDDILAGRVPVPQEVRSDSRPRASCVCRPSAARLADTLSAACGAFDHRLTRRSCTCQPCRIRPVRPLNLTADHSSMASLALAQHPARWSCNVATRAVSSACGDDCGVPACNRAEKDVLHVCRWSRCTTTCAPQRSSTPRQSTRLPPTWQRRQAVTGPCEMPRTSAPRRICNLLPHACKTKARCLMCPVHGARCMDRGRSMRNGGSGASAGGGHDGTGCTHGARRRRHLRRRHG